MATKFVDYQKVRGVNALVGASAQGSGNEIEIDIPGKRLQLLVPDDELDRRREEWTPPPPRVSSGYLARYAAIVGDASTGAVLQAR